MLSLSLSHHDTLLQNATHSLQNTTVIAIASILLQNVAVLTKGNVYYKIHRYTVLKCAT